ncbi:MAG TPA: BatA domain-containing protein, partial [Hyphomicrobiaceae bacterium]|nr:BatA domain-containing protein [Hyphomicrobiaceae bacterium]
MTIGALGFLSPVLLLGLLALPIIYWLLRAVPPRPQQIEFPATRILVGIENKERTPHKTPWWLVLLRMLAAALVILALAEPVLNPNREQGLKGAGPVVLVVDNGWSAGTRWSERARLVERYINEAEATGRPVLIAGTALASKAQTFKIEPPGAARSTAAALQPQPFEPNRVEVAKRIREAFGPSAPSGLSVVWLGDGIDHSGEGRVFAETLLALGSGSSVSLVETTAGDEALGILSGVGAAGKLEATVIRAAGGPRAGFVHAFSGRGQRLGEVAFRFFGSEKRTSVAFDIPLEIRNQVTRLEIASERSAGAVHLLDARSQWHRVGLISSESREQAQPLLAPLYYIQKALQPYSELVPTKDATLPAAIETVLKRNVSVMVLADIGTLPGDLRPRIEEFVRKGGVLVRFAGPRLERGGDELIPVELRTGGLTRGGALSWSKPEPLASFSEDSLFVGLEVPADVQVSRQVLADPAKLGPDVKIWARLKDGTPLVTAKKLGEGQMVLFHVTANSEWSNLPMSGLFVEMLRRLATLGTMSSLGSGDADVADQSRVVSGAGADVLAPSQVLDGFGILRAPPPTAQAIAMKSLATIKPSLDHPPGYYGPQGVPRAFNLIGVKSELRPLSGLPSGIERRAYEGSTQRLLKPDLLTIALSLLLIDVIIVILMQMGNFWRQRLATRGTAALVVALALGGALLGALDGAKPAAAQGLGQSPQPPGLTPPRSRDEQVAIAATGKVSFAYVITGDRAVDETSRAGLKGL